MLSPFHWSVLPLKRLSVGEVTGFVQNHERSSDLQYLNSRTGQNLSLPQVTRVIRNQFPEYTRCLFYRRPISVALFTRSRCVTCFGFVSSHGQESTEPPSVSRGHTRHNRRRGSRRLCPDLRSRVHVYSQRPLHSWKQ
jgi:hypothetical protein